MRKPRSVARGGSAKLYYFPVARNPTKLRLYPAEKREGGARIELERLADLALR